MFNDRRKCDGCVFKAMNGPYQVGCMAHDISEEEYSVDINQSFVFSKKVCQYKTCKKVPIQKVRDSIRFKYTLFLECNKDTDIKDVFNSFNSLYCKPSSYIFVCDSQQTEGVVSNHMFTTGAKNWKSTVNLDKAVSNIDYCIRVFKTFRYVYVKDFNFYAQFFDWLDCQINDNNFGFSFVGGDVKIFNRAIYDSTLLPLSEIESQLCKHTFSDLYNEFKNGNNWRLGEKRFC